MYRGLQVLCKIFDEFGHRGASQQFGKCCCRIGIDHAVFRDGLRCLMGHFRLRAMMLVEEIIKTLCIQTPIIIQDMCILLLFYPWAISR